jgi:hypothetical protein
MSDHFTHSKSFFKSHLERGGKKEIISLSTAVTFIVAINKFLIRKVFFHQSIPTS